MNENPQSLSRVPMPSRPIPFIAPPKHEAQPASPQGGGNRPPTGTLNSSLLLLVLIAVLGVGFVLLKTRRSESVQSVQAAASQAPAAISISMSETEDLLRHLESSSAYVRKASGEIKRSESWVGRTVPSLEQNYMQMDKKRLQASLAASESARRYVRQSLDELEIAKNLLIERSKTK